MNGIGEELAGKVGRSRGLVDVMDQSGYVTDNTEVSQKLNVNNNLRNRASALTGTKIDWSKVFDPVIKIEDASHLLKINKQGAMGSKKKKDTSKERNATNTNYIVLETSSEDEKEVSRESSVEYIPSKSRQDDKEESISDDLISDSDSADAKSKKRTRAAVYSSDDEDINPKSTKSKKRRVVISDSDLDLSDGDINCDKNNSSDDEDDKSTVDAEEAEKERRKRLIEQQREFNGIEFETILSTDGNSLVKKLKKLVLDEDVKSENPNPVVVDPKIVRHLKNYQTDGIKFMYQNAIESLDRFRRGDRGGGAILAHCMGLGKTLQTISFVHSVLSHSELSKEISKVLIVVPKNVVINWKREFDKWLRNNHYTLDTFNVSELDSFKNDTDRLMCLRNWQEDENPAVMICGYDLFRLLCQSEEDRIVKKNKPPPKPKKPTRKQIQFQKLQVEFRKHLQDPGPDLVICDEAHKLKNDESITCRTMLKIKTKRRICLTGTPLQNNLDEYYVMVSFVKPGLLGTKSEYANRFVNIINQGRTKDATEYEVRLMRKRCHVLFDRLKYVVQRKSIDVLKQEIPGKVEYILKVRLTEIQSRLYQQFIDNMVPDKGKDELRKRLFADYFILSRVWTHPFQLIHREQEAERKRMLKDDMDDFIVDSDVSESSETELELDDGDSDECVSKKPINVRSSNRLAGREASQSPTDFPDSTCLGWWGKEIDPSCKFKVEMSNKLIILFDIIKRCETIGDKLLVFSQSLESLRLIKDFLEEFDRTDTWFNDHECVAARGEKWGWRKGLDYMMIDGSVSGIDREKIQNSFNKVTNFRSRLMLISTKAGCLGTNMIGANRVVIFDSCWNPSHDTQSLFRVYRLGQTKPVYVYRLVASGTMEDCIYRRQVTKDSTALRVIDEAQIQRHFLDRDLKELYTLNYQPYIPRLSQTLQLPKDRLLADLLLNHPGAIVDYLFHDNLFENLEDEKLTPEEIAEAWQEYENQKAKGNNAQVNPGIQAINSALQTPNLISNVSASSLGRLNGVEIDSSFASIVMNDPIFKVALVADLNIVQATKVAYVKLILHSLLEKIPVQERDGIAEFGTVITDILRNQNSTNDDRTLRTVDLFQTMASSFSRSPMVKDLVQRYYQQSPWLRQVRKLQVIVPNLRKT